MTKVAFYVRVSSKKKQDYLRQIEELQDVLGQKKDQFKIDVFQEKESGYKDDRVELTRLIEKIKENNKYYKCIYITEISRLGRSPRKIREILWELEDAKVNLFIKKGSIWLLNEDGSLNTLGRLVVDIMISLADEEAITFKERSRSGILSSIRAGKVNGGKFKPYGFRTGANKMMEIDDEEAVVVNIIYDMYKSGKGVKVIAGHLNDKKIPTRTNKSFGDKPINQYTGKLGSEVVWSDKTVDDILKNPIYKGKRRYWGGRDKKEKPMLIALKIQDKDTIVEEDLWEECMEIRKSKTHRNYTTVYTYLLKNKLKCGCCGRNYFAKYKPVPNGDKVYICSSRLTKNGNCGNVGVNISLIESAIFNEIVDSDSILQHINNADKLRKTFEQDLSDLSISLANTNNLIEELNNEIEGALDLQVDANGKGQMERVVRLEKKIVGFENNLVNAKLKLNKEKRVFAITETALKEQSNIKTTSKTLRNHTKDRLMLRKVYLQIIHKIIINSIDKNTVLASFYITIDGVLLPKPLKLFLNVSGMRKKIKNYNYLPLVDMKYSPEYKNNILITDIEKIKEELYVINENAGLLNVETVSIPKHHILKIIPPS